MLKQIINNFLFYALLAISNVTGVVLYYIFFLNPLFKYRLNIYLFYIIVAIALAVLFSVFTFIFSWSFAKSLKFSNGKIRWITLTQFLFFVLLYGAIFLIFFHG